MAKQTASVCAKCGKPVGEGVKFCPSCGTAVQQAAPKETAAKKPLNCPKCGKKLPDDVKFCPSCGASVTDISPGAAEQQADPDDAEKNKGMAIIAYILFFVPLITGDHKKSPFVKFHTNQGTVLAIASTALMIVWSIIRAILMAIFGSLYSVSLSAIYSGSYLRRASAALVFLRISSIVTWVFVLLIMALLAIGILNAVKGKMKPLPVIGKFTIIK